MTDLKTVNDGDFACNGGAFFWVALHDTNGQWSDAVVGEVSKTAGKVYKIFSHAKYLSMLIILLILSLYSL